MCDGTLCDSDEENPCNGKCWVDEELVELFAEFDRVRDVYKIDRLDDGMLQITVYEVEVTHHLTDDKVVDYANLWGCVGIAPLRAWHGLCAGRGLTRIVCTLILCTR